MIGVDPGDDAVTLSEAVISSVAAHKGIEATELPPLYDVLDPDALDALFETSSGRADGAVTFVYAGCTVECASDGSVDVRDAP